jgi:hypothetical protein
MVSPMNVIRLPFVSDNGPQKDGATACATIYIVTVSERYGGLTLISYGKKY